MKIQCIHVMPWTHAYTISAIDNFCICYGTNTLSFDAMWETNYSARWLAVTISGDHKEIIYKNAVCDSVHTSPERVQNGAKNSKFAVAFTRYGSKLCENVILTGEIWKRFLHGARWKRNPWRSHMLFSLLYLKSLRFKWTLANPSTHFNGFVWRTHENSAVIFSCRHRVNAVWNNKRRLTKDLQERRFTKGMVNTYLLLWRHVGNQLQRSLQRLGGHPKIFLT